MPVAPLFVTDMATLKQRLRLSGVVADTDAAELIEELVLSTRLDFFRALGQTKLGVLTSTTLNEAPSTDAGYKRLLAERLEVVRVRWYGLRDLPVHFLGSEQTRNAWNQEGIHMPGRRADVEALRKELDAVWQAGISELLADELSNSKLKILDITPYSDADSDDKPTPGGSTGRTLGITLSP